MLELDDEISWPMAACALLRQERDLLVAYEEKRREIDLLIQSSNVCWRLSPPVNPFTERRGELIAKIDALIAYKSIHRMALHPAPASRAANHRRKGLPTLASSNGMGRMHNIMTRGD